MQRSLKLLAAAAVFVVASGCAQFAVQSTATGASAADVRARAGAPSDERTVGGVKVWDYVQGPLGFTTWRVTFDRSDRVASVEQILTEKRIHSLKPDESTREDVANLLGRPIETTRYGRTGSEVWTYRFIDGQERRLGDVFIAAGTGKVRFTTTYPDPAHGSALTD